MSVGGAEAVEQRGVEDTLIGRSGVQWGGGSIQQRASRARQMSVSGEKDRDRAMS
jgi:hypothetical protein